MTLLSLGLRRCRGTHEIVKIFKLWGNNSKAEKLTVGNSDVDIILQKFVHLMMDYTDPAPAQWERLLVY